MFLTFGFACKNHSKSKIVSKSGEETEIIDDQIEIHLKLCQGLSIRVRRDRDQSFQRKYYIKHKCHGGGFKGSDPPPGKFFCNLSPRDNLWGI